MVSRESEEWPVFTESFIATMCHDLRHAVDMFFILVSMCLTYKQHIAVFFLPCLAHSYIFIMYVTFLIINLCVWYAFREIMFETNPMLATSMLWSYFVQQGVATV